MRYFTTPSSIATRSDPDWVAPEGWTEIGEKLHDTLAAEQAAETQKRLDADAAARAALAEQDYADMIAAGIPERVARRLTGHEEKGS